MDRLFSADDVIETLRHRIEKAGSLKEFADAHGLSTETIRLILTKRRPPSGKTLAVIGFRKAELYEVIK